ncbi:hypothetical protein HCN44_007095 [Aphidius gifuensis]|uniref:EF-hand domain-containing protein n=1 Tax=Aphidius gifuensis TaxID=684658 RepID=A0A834XKU9_APHGI|nr:hypothetical protein HCN44_007095 [Aphidius gifuensis]
MTSIHDNEVEVLIPIEYKNSIWKKIFDKYDSDHDGKISYHEFEKLLFKIARNEYVSNKILSQIKNYSHEIGYLEYLEYIAMIERRDLPERKSIVTQSLEFNFTDEKEYSHYSSALFMIVLSIIEIGIFMYDAFVSQTQEEIAQWLIYNPSRKAESWRFLTYMFVHVGLFQLIFNIIIQLMIGIPFAMVNKWYRVFIVFFAGVLAGSFCTSIFYPNTYLAGASGGVYALITAYAADVISQWRQRKVSSLRICIFSLIIVLDFSLAIAKPYTYLDNRYGLDKKKQISCVGHIAGAITGILVGIDVLGNVKNQPWKELACTVGVLIYTIFMMIINSYKVRPIVDDKSLMITERKIKVNELTSQIDDILSKAEVFLFNEMKYYFRNNVNMFKNISKKIDSMNFIDDQEDDVCRDKIMDDFHQLDIDANQGIKNCYDKEILKFSNIIESITLDGLGIHSQLDNNNDDMLNSIEDKIRLFEKNIKFVKNGYEDTFKIDMLVCCSDVVVDYVEAAERMIKEGDECTNHSNKIKD